jgi:hypothetical protein
MGQGVAREQENQGGKVKVGMAGPRALPRLFPMLVEKALLTEPAPDQARTERITSTAYHDAQVPLPIGQPQVACTSANRLPEDHTPKSPEPSLRTSLCVEKWSKAACALLPTNVADPEEVIVPLGQ